MTSRETIVQCRTWTLTGADGRPYESERPGTLGGHRRNRIYGRLDCPGALRWIARGKYVAHRVFFLDEAAAIAAGYRPCAVCFPDAYRQWKARNAMSPTELDASTARLLKQIETRWRELRDAIAGLRPEELVEPGACDGWSVRDLIAHVTIWEEEALKHLPAIIAGERPATYQSAYGGLNAFNHAAVEERTGMPIEDVLARFEATHRQLIAFIENAGPGTFDGKSRARRRLRLDTYGHYPEHTEQILAWRAARS